MCTWRVRKSNFELYTYIGHWLYDFYGDHKRRKEEGEEKIEEKIDTQSERMFCLNGFKG